jgi:hypothetical protein
MWEGRCRYATTTTMTTRSIREDADLIRGL